MGVTESKEPKTEVKNESESYTAAEYKAMKADLKLLADDECTTISWQKTNFQIKQNNSQMLSILDNLGTLTFNSVMGADKGDTSTKKYPIGPDGKRLKPCCACPETKRARDACIIENGEENCSELIEAHKTCMRNLGFNV